jgi:hypothetical protein
MIEENIRERIEAEKEVRESIHAVNKSPKKADSIHEKQVLTKTNSNDGSLKSESNDKNEKGGLSISTTSEAPAVSGGSPLSSPQAPLGSPGLSPKISRSNFRLHLTGEDNIERLTNISKTASFSPSHKSPSSARKYLNDTTVVNPMVIPDSPERSPPGTENPENLENHDK